ncbi:hypothetical protein [Halobellus rarus]|uniref:Uncharacterized protein n=1 Tax=Halobellus rarus TaxID=1126237 RepID=A0ABD6CK35_9EURY
MLSASAATDLLAETSLSVLATVAPALAGLGGSGGDVGRFVLVCVACGLLGAVVMDFPMSKQEDGFAPAYVAAALLRRTPPGEVPFREAVVVHHATGAIAGGLYAVVFLLSAAVLPAGAVVGGVEAIPHVVAAAAVAAFVYGFFAHVVLPRAGRGIYEERATAVRGQWLRSAVVFGVAIGVTVPVLTSVL